MGALHFGQNSVKGLQVVSYNILQSLENLTLYIQIERAGSE